MGTNTTTTQLTSALKASFCRTGAPDEMWTDQGPQFTSKSFQDFARQWGFEHSTSSPRYPQSNGEAEATVKSMKKIIRAAWTGRYIDEEKLTRALLQYRNTPSRKDGQSPAQKLFGHPIQDTLPAHRRAFDSEWQRSSQAAEKRAITTREAVERSYNHHARILPEIIVGSKVALQNNETKRWNIYETVTDIGPHRRYFVKTQSGRILVRNRRFLRRRVPTSLPQPWSQPEQPPIAAPVRSSSRRHQKPQRLVEEMTTFSFQVSRLTDMEAPRRGGVGN